VGARLTWNSRAAVKLSALTVPSLRGVCNSESRRPFKLVGFPRVRAHISVDMLSTSEEIFSVFALAACEVTVVCKFEDFASLLVVAHVRGFGAGSACCVLASCPLPTGRSLEPADAVHVNASQSDTSLQVNGRFAAAYISNVLPRDSRKF
jgi:hypothetical protein